MVEGAAPAETAKRRNEYVVTALTGFHVAAEKSRDSLKRLQELRPVQVIGSIREDGEKLVLINEEELRSLKASMPGLVIEPNILYKKARHPSLQDFEPLFQEASAERNCTVRVLDQNTSAPIAGADVYVITDSNRKIGFKATTDASGECGFAFRVIPSSATLIVLPRVGYWSRRIKAAALSHVNELALRPLPPLRPEKYDWGHEFSGMQDNVAGGGESVKIGVIDTGICNNHDDVRSSGGTNCVFGEDDKVWFDDVDGHGTHCAGIIAALLNNLGLKGYVPRANIRSYRVFSNNTGGASTFDIMDAVERAVQDGCDIINMSLSSTTPQTALRVKMEFAYERGVLCVAATGNEGADVAYPAAFPAVVGVTAFGKLGTYPEDSLHADSESTVRTADGNLFMAKFSNTGAHVDFCAPGVAITSTVPGGYSAWDGTSMACPHVTAMAALALGSHPELTATVKDAGRIEMLLKYLKGCTESLGFGARYEGAGCLRVSNIINGEIS